MLKNNRIDDGHFFEFLFLLFLKAKIQTSAFGEFTESFLQYQIYERITYLLFVFIMTLKL
jgi:hypothetical protein